MTHLSRRALLGLAAAVPLAACTGEPEPPPPPDPDDVLREQAVAREVALLAQYDAAVRALPALAARLAPIREEHAQHLGALLGAQASAAPSPPATPPPADAAAALRALVALERDTGAAHGRAALEASRELAGLLASLSASETSHPVALS